MLIAKIALPLPLRRLFDYQIPPAFASCAQPGIRVKVPFGPKQLIGLLVRVDNQSTLASDKLKPLLECLDSSPLLPPTIQQLVIWASRYYQNSLGEVFFQALPVWLRQGRSEQATQQPSYCLASHITEQDITQLPSNAVKQKQALLLLANASGSLSKSALQHEHSVSLVTLKRLLDKGWIQQRHEPLTAAECTVKPSPLQLNEQQQMALSAVKQSTGFSAFLLYGITGSGKTEVYLQLIAHYLQHGKQILVLIPEIGLTPQTLQRFADRFDTEILVMHSNLSEGERYQAWYKAKHGLCHIVIGTRSAIFAPLQNLGLIIVDEEHDSSFKQNDSFYYHGRDLAVRRAQLENIPVILGSATPSLESLYNAQQQRYQLLKLTQRAGNAQLPRYHMIDLRHQIVDEGLTPPLINAIRHTLKQQQQVLLFLNRRGYAPTLLCHSCGWVATCQRCELKFTLHQQQKKLHCHHCDTQRPLPVQCAECGSTELMALGLGTERIEQKLCELFPDVPVLRIDRDSTARKQAMDQFLKQIHSGAPQILLGTQMLAKGHHFPNVTLVALIDADRGLLSSDFRAHERFAQLFIQVAGRAGREDKPGRVLIQTHQPDHPLLQQLTQQNYLGLSKQLLQERQQTDFPPYSYLVLIQAEATQQPLMFAFLQQVATLSMQLHNVFALGPIAAPIAKRAGKYRGQLLLQSDNRQQLQQQLPQLLQQIEQAPETKKVRWRLDVDPLDIY